MTILDLDHYFLLGRTGLRVSPVGLGTMTFGTGGWHAGEEAARAIFHRYLDRGGNFIDTADIYGAGASEELLGRLIQETGSRDRLVLATKFGGPTDPSDPNARGNGRKHILPALEASLRRLQTDYVDLYWLHLWDQVTGVEEVMSTLDTLVRGGKVRAVGLSNVPAWWATKAQMLAHHRGWEPVAALQLEYSLVERTAEWEHVPAAQDLGMAIVAWSPLANGFLTGKYERQLSESAGRLSAGSQWPLPVTPSEQHWQILGVLRTIAAEVGRAPAQVALNWIISRPAILGTLIGATTVEQLDANLDALGIELSPEQLALLDQAGRPEPVMTPHSLFARFPARPPYVHRCVG
ncbi:aldo/keto reductase [Plantactinospora mayteni]|uniref:Aldo/keto reductase n=1 Tax=Plantactinospora mayteni TaxID=566021 RepID=A0ABQ4EUH0_9ACTN|nr:aldo/keto reductase [Plantactinospora mayteni]GIG98313.1 aldo/keto reductase [Plantactinospora mayteni]